MQDPAVLRDLHSIWMRAMERAGLTLADLRSSDGTDDYPETR